MRPSLQEILLESVGETLDAADFFDSIVSEKP
jgi:hypothetical protein